MSRYERWMSIQKSISGQPYSVGELPIGATMRVYLGGPAE